MIRYAVLAAALGCATNIVASPVAHADTDPEMRAAKRHYDRGEKFFALGKFREALDAYQAAYDEKPFPAFLFNIGQCHRNLGDYEAAIFSFRKFLDLSPDAENRDQVEEYIRDLEKEQERANAKRLDLVDKKPRRKPEPTTQKDDGSILTRWWFWTAVGVVAVGGGVGIYVATRPADAPSTDLGNIVFTK